MRWSRKTKLLSAMRHECFCSAQYERTAMSACSTSPPGRGWLPGHLQGRGGRGRVILPLWFQCVISDCPPQDHQGLANLWRFGQANLQKSPFGTDAPICTQWHMYTRTHTHTHKHKHKHKHKHTHTHTHTHAHNLTRCFPCKYKVQQKHKNIRKYVWNIETVHLVIYSI